MKNRRWTIVISTCALVVAAFAAPPARAEEPRRREVGQVILEDVPEVPAALRDRMQQYLNVRAASLLDFDDAGERILISTRFGNTEQLHIVDHPGGDRRQITFFDEPIRVAQFVPGTHGQRLMYAIDRGGTENNQI